MIKLTFAVIAFVLLSAACTANPLNEERVKPLLSEQEAHAAIGLHIAKEIQFLDIAEADHLLAQEEMHALIMARGAGLVDRQGVIFVTETGFGSVSLDIEEFATDRHAREQLVVLIERNGLTPTATRVGYRSVEGAIGDVDSASLLASLEVSFVTGRRVVSLHVSADPHADLTPYRDGLRQLAELVDGRL